MTTWTTFETIDETERFTEFYIDRLGMHSYVRDLERTRFQLTRSDDSWYAVDLEALDAADDLDEMSESTKFGSMREVIHWVAGRVLYGA